MSRQSRCTGGGEARCACAALRLDEARARTLAHFERWYAAKGWTVRTRLPGKGLPPRLAGHLPDLYASDGEHELALDVAGPAEEAHAEALRGWAAVAPERRAYAVEAVHGSDKKLKTRLPGLLRSGG